MRAIQAPLVPSPHSLVPLPAAILRYSAPSLRPFAPIPAPADNSHYTDAEKLDTIVEIVAPVSAPGVTDSREGSGPTPVHSPLHAFVSVLSPSTSLTHTVRPRTDGDGQKLFYAQLIQCSGYSTVAAKKDGSTALVKITGGDEEVVLGEGDGVFVRGAKTADGVTIENVGKVKGELIFFEMDA